MRITLEITIAAPPAHVWRALCDPDEVTRWDTGVVEALDASPDYPQPGQHVRWRYRSRLFPILHDRPQTVVPERELHAHLALGPYRYDERYSLESSAGDTRLTLTLDVTTALPLIGPLVSRIYLVPSTRRGVAESLATLKRHCERT